MKTDQYYVNSDTFLQKLRSNLSENGENYVTWLVLTTPKYICFGFQFKEFLWNGVVEAQGVGEHEVGRAIKRIKTVFELLEEAQGTCIVGYEYAQNEFAYLLSLEGSEREEFRLDLDNRKLNRPNLTVLSINLILKDQPKFSNLVNSTHKTDHYFLTAFLNQPYQDPPSIPNKLSDHTKEERIKPRFRANQKALFEMASHTKEWITIRSQFADFLGVPPKRIISHSTNSLVEDFII